MNLYFQLFSTMCVISLARPSQLDDIFVGYLKNVNLYSPEKQSQIVKRRVYEDNQDGSLKKISLQSLIGDLEQNFLQSASNAGSLAHQTTESTESHLNASENHSVIKRKAESEKPASVELINASDENTSNKAPGSTRIQVEHISVQPHFGNFPIVPAFQLQHTKLISATFKDTDSKPTQITITKTNIQATPAQEKLEAINDHAEVNKRTEANGEIKDEIEKNNNSKQPANEKPENLSPSSTKSPASDLKQTEAELKANVAEIEAEPVILSARV
uniref:Probable pre-mRNA-splicing factor ATP-dependent RNA helicase mog-4 n=1 Tax=Zeugodacus cucurbitae TaxID=28588 RepID=A0A0A1XE71_ZEUCU